jgi:beta-glucosidase
MKRLFLLPAFMLLLSGFQDPLSPTLSTSAAVSTITTEDPVEQRVEALLAKMTLEEKIGQTAQRGTSSREKTLSESLKEAVRKGQVGSVLNVMNKDYVEELQRIAVEESPNGIPLIFARDVIHGFKTIFPIPLGQAATWNPEIVEKGSRIAAEEASTYGIRWTFAPMLDISRDPRWGRIAESPGEDPYLASVLGKAYVKGFQGDDLSSPTSLAACGKHFIGYGAAEGGRDYNTAHIPEQLLRDVYLKPFKAAHEAGAASFMTSFNDINGVPATANKFLLKDVLRDEWGFDGIVVSDWNSVTEMIAHGYAEDEKAAARRAANAGMDMEMTSRAYEHHLKALIEEGRFTEAQLDDMVRHILRVKFRLGLFENPGFDRNEEGIILSEANLAAAKEAAIKSMVLLKNEQDLLPLSKDLKKVAVIGPLADAAREQLGTWIFDGDKKDSRTPVPAIKSYLGKDKVIFEPGLTFSRQKIKEGFAKAVAAAKKSDVILFIGGEEAILSGEAHSRGDIRLPGGQEELILELSKTGKPIVLVIMAGRPITMENILDKVNSVVMAWHPGTMAGPALSDVLFGEASPSGRLPLTWPKAVGQVPIYYNHVNTGRPADSASFVHIDDIPIEAWQSSLGNNSHYLDLGFKPQYPFGYGLSYTTFQYDNLKISKSAIALGETLSITADIKNTGSRAGTETVQLYVRDLVGDLVRPVKELKGFQQVTLEPGEQQTVSFSVHTDDLGFYNQAKEYVTEPGQFHLWVGKNAEEGLQGSFEIEAEKGL